MRCLAILLVCVAVASATTLRFDAPNPEHNDEWVAYKKVFNKKYPTLVHETVRRIQWEENLKYIQQHNIDADLGKYTYRLGLNEIADLSNEEYKQMLLCGGRNTTARGASIFLPPSNVQLPATVDWRPKGYVTPVKNQGQCGSCWAFSATGSMEGQHFKKTGKLVSLSEQNLMDCSIPYGNHGCQGGLPDNAFRYVKSNNGIDTEASYPYEMRNGRCRFKAADVGATITGFTDIEKGSEADLQSASATVGPISVGIDASHITFQLYRSGVYYAPLCSTTVLDHGVLVVGYGTEGTKDYWLVKNSWGASWGMQGYIRMSRNRNNNCGIATMASYPLV